MDSITRLLISSSTSRVKSNIRIEREPFQCCKKSVQPFVQSGLKPESLHMEALKPISVFLPLISILSS